MKKLYGSMFGAALLAAATATASAQDMSGGKAGPAEPMASVPAKSITSRAKPQPGLTADRSATRAAPMGDDPAKGMALVGRSKDGKDIRMEATGGGTMAAKPTPKPGVAAGQGADPAFAAEDARAIVGTDDRLQVTATTRFPFSTIGYLEMETTKGEFWSCTATLIGPKTVITAANCLYRHEEEGGWRQNFVFWPALAGENTVPYDGVPAEAAWIIQGYIDGYANGGYEAVWPYDIGLVVLQQPIGDSVGWLGYQSEPGIDFQANVVGYPVDKTAFTMWRANCTVMSENVSDYDIVHTCDTVDGMNGAPMYIYDEATKSRNVVGIHIGEIGEQNWALRLYPAIIEWINTINTN